MYKRKLMNDLVKWKDNGAKKCLIVEGSRQVGKTYIIQRFGEQYYGIENCIFINFELDESKKAIFTDDITADSIYTKLSLLYRDTLKGDGKNFLFLDEIQACPRAITALKSLSIDKRFDVIASGSLLGINYKHVSSFPVGFVDRLAMYPMDFEEFLWSRKIDDIYVKELKENFEKKKQVSAFMHQEMMKLFREYIIVGGMPEVVVTFNTTKDFTKVLNNQKRIVDDYKSDMAKYAHGSDKARAKECFESLPFQLGKDNKKFQYKHVSRGGRSSMYEGSIQWLIDAGLVLKCSNLTKPEIPLASYKRIDVYKLYASDIGLLVSMLGLDAQTKIAFGDLGISKGALYENIIACMLTYSKYELYYFEKNSQLEIDFIIIKDSKVTGIEVKSADNVKAKSLKSFISNHGGERGIKLSSKNIYEKDNELRIPLYMAMFL